MRIGAGEENVEADRTENQVRLKDGGMLGYGEYGAPDGKPVFYFMGIPVRGLIGPASLMSTILPLS